MTYLNITIETDNTDDEGYVIEENYFVAFPFSDDAMTLWSSIEDMLENEFVESVLWFEVGTNGIGNELFVDNIDEIAALREEEDRLQAEADA